MHLSPEQLAEVRANAQRTINRTTRSQPADRDDMEQEIVSHFLQLDGSYTDHPPAYWARVIHNCIRSIKRREHAQKRGGGNIRQLPNDDTLAARPLPDPLDAESLREAVQRATEGARALARLLSSETQRAAGQALGLGRSDIAALKRALQDELRLFDNTGDDRRARPRADCVNEGRNHHVRRNHEHV